MNSNFWRPLHSRLGATALMTLSLLGSAGCKSREEDVPTPAVSVQAAPPTVGPISEKIVVDAILAPLSQAALVPRLSAPIQREYVQRGQRVRRGQLLISLENRDLEGAAADTRGAVTTARAAVRTTLNASIPEDVQKAQADLLQAEAARDVASRTAEERKRLYKEGALSGRDADTAYAAAVQATAALDVAKKHLETVLSTTRTTSRQTAEGQLTSAQGKLTSAEAQVGYAQLRSPINGVVTERPFFPGETALPGSALVTVMDTSALLAKMHLAQERVQMLRVGDKAEVAIPGLQAPVLGAVSFLGPALDPGSTTIEVWIRIPNSDGTLKVGTPVHTTLTGTTIPRALLVPSSAINPGADGNAAVLLLGSDGKAHTRSVKVGIRSADTVQILSGLTTADDVIFEGGYGLEDGTKVVNHQSGMDEGGQKE